jgi:hypothetical protein
MSLKALLASRRWLPLAAAALAVAALATTTGVSMAGFSAQIVDNANHFSSGTMQLEETDGSLSCYSTGSGAGGSVSATNSATCAINKLVGTLDQVPGGTPLTTTVTVANVGSAAASLDSLVMGACTVSAASDDNGYVGTDLSGFCAKVDLSIGISGKCIYPPNPSAACPSVPTNTGNLAAVAGATFNQDSTPPLPLLSAGASQAYTFTVMLDPSATNADQGLTANMTMTWNQA